MQLADTLLLVLFVVAVATICGSAAVYKWQHKHGYSAGVRIDPSRHATVLVASRGIVLIWPGIFSACAASVLYLYLKFYGTLPWHSGGRTAYATVMAGVTAVVSAVIGLEFLRGGYRTVRLTLDPETLRYRASTAETCLPWSAITAVTGGTKRAGSRPNARVTVPIVTITFDPHAPGVTSRSSTPLSKPAGEGITRTGILEIRPEGFGVGAPAVLYALRRYAENPELRAELGSEQSRDDIVAAVERKGKDRAYGD